MTTSMLGFPIPVNQLSYDAAITLSEGTRQSDIGVARAVYADVPANYPTFQTSVAAADAAHVVRVAAAKAQYPLTVTN